MKNQKTKKVLLGLSGGVDSAVAALLLKQQGYDVICAFMINFSDTKNKLTGDCNYLEDKKDAQKIASILNIPLKILNFEKQYKKLVINPMFEDYKKGLTPNPDSLCNKIIKFPLLWKEAKKLGCDYIATGHYIKKIKKENKYLLKIPKDKSKDQSYFLYDLTQKDLSHTLFPLADLTKQEVRTIAKKHKFPNYDKKSTSGICFVGKINMKKFLQQKIKPKPGNVIAVPTLREGNIIGQHPGIFYFTIGERVKDSQIQINKEYRNKIKNKLFVAKKNIKENELIIAPEKDKSLLNNKFKIININWISNNPKLPLSCKVRIRHQGKLYPATLSVPKSQEKIITLKKSIKGIAPGQSCIIYKNNFIIGGGEIKI